jgi:deoxycytidylate deaminase
MYEDQLMAMAFLAAAKGEDPDTNNGVVIAGDSPIVTGATKRVRCSSLEPAMLERPEKYKWMVHAEMDAIFKCANMGGGGHFMSSVFPPCRECAKAIIEVEISHLIVYMDWENDDAPVTSFRYEAVDPRGKPMGGEVDAKSETEATNKVRAMGDLQPIRVIPIKMGLHEAWEEWGESIDEGNWLLRQACVKVRPYDGPPLPAGLKTKLRGRDYPGG